MDGNPLATRTVLSVGAVLVIAGAVVALFAGFGPAPGGLDGSPADSTPTEPPDGTGSDGDTGDGTAGNAGDSTAPPFAFSVQEIETCGWKCRDVTGTLTNEQPSAASSVTISTKIYAGNGTDGGVVWKDTERVGTLSAGETYTITERVKLSWGEAYTIRQKGGWITIRTKLQSDSQTLTYTDRRDVA